LNPFTMRPFLQGKKTLVAEALHPPTFKAALPIAGSVTAPTAPGGPTIEVVKEGDKIVRLVVTCACGERMEVECLYRAGA
jgi:hypothetical protein